jgi:hypothetical protein
MVVVKGTAGTAVTVVPLLPTSELILTTSMVKTIVAVVLILPLTMALVSMTTQWTQMKSMSFAFVL